MQNKNIFLISLLNISEISAEDGGSMVVTFSCLETSLLGPGLVQGKALKEVRMELVLVQYHGFWGF